MANYAAGVVGLGTPYGEICVVLILLGAITILVVEVASKRNVDCLKWSFWLIKFEVRYKDANVGTPADTQKRADRTGRGRTKGHSETRGKTQEPSGKRPKSDRARRTTDREMQRRSDPKDR